MFHHWEGVNAKYRGTDVGFLAKTIFVLGSIINMRTAMMMQYAPFSPVANQNELECLY